MAIEAKIETPNQRTETSGDRYAAAVGAYHSGRLDRAETLCKQILRKAQRHGDALHLLGLIAAARGRPQRARQLFEKAIGADSSIAAFHHSLGLLNRSCGEIDAAATAFEHAIACDPSHAPFHAALGNARKAQGRFEEAVASHNEAIARDETYAEAWSNLGSTYREWGKYEQAVDSLKRAIELRPDLADLHYNLGNALLAADRLEEAASGFDHALALAPGHVRARTNLGVALKEQGRLQPAIASFYEAIGLDPAFAEAHWNLGLALLMTGRYIEGWAAYEWRRRLNDSPVLPHDLPQWDGNAAAGKTLLIHAEQGLGDALQFIRYADVANRQGARVHFESPPELARLLRPMAGIDKIVTRGEDAPGADMQAPLLSLPLIVGTTRETVPAEIPYITAEPDLIEHWRTRLAGDDAFKIGICWQGNPDYRFDRRRSPPLHNFAPLAAVPGVRLYSLQKGDGSTQLAEIGKDFPVIDLGDDIDAGGDAFVDTAAVMANLDLVVCSDTSIPHLAGAMGIEVWLMLAHVPDWRWGLVATDSPWYPSMRLFRQSRPGDWEGVFTNVAEALRQRLSTK